MLSLINTNYIRSTFHVCTRKAKIRTILDLIAYILYCGFQAVKMSIFRIADSWFWFAQNIDCGYVNRFICLRRTIMYTPITPYHEMNHDRKEIDLSLR